MLCDTHRLIADKVYEAVKKELGVKLDYKSFSDGSTAPDIVPRMVVIPHVFRNSEKLLYVRINWLCAQELNYEEHDLAAFSYELGIVIHFISDFFCRTHNGRIRFYNFISHRIYEKKLKNFFEKNIRKFCYFAGNINWRESIDDIRAFLPSKIEEYKRNGMSCGMDMNYSLEVSVNVALKIIFRCIENRLDAVRKAA